MWDSRRSISERPGISADTIADVFASDEPPRNTPMSAPKSIAQFELRVRERFEKLPPILHRVTMQ